MVRLGGFFPPSIFESCLLGSPSLMFSFGVLNIFEEHFQVFEMCARG